MPVLKQIKCHIEFSAKNIPLREYGTVYGDGVVQSYVVVPEKSDLFSIHLTSQGYIAPGLAMFVFMDGVAQCNRNRRGLLIPSSDTPAQDTEVDFRVRQKEERFQDKFISREWSFAGLNTVAADKAVETRKQTLDNIGTIEVVVLRCYGHAGRDGNTKAAMSQPSKSGNGNLDGADDNCDSPYAKGIGFGLDGAGGPWTPSPPKPGMYYPQARDPLAGLGEAFQRRGIKGYSPPKFDGQNDTRKPPDPVAAAPLWTTGQLPGIGQPPQTYTNPHMYQPWPYSWYGQQPGQYHYPYQYGQQPSQLPYPPQHGQQGQTDQWAPMWASTAPAANTQVGKANSNPRANSVASPAKSKDDRIWGDTDPKSPKADENNWDNQSRKPSEQGSNKVGGGSGNDAGDWGAQSNKGSDKSNSKIWDGGADAKDENGIGRGNNWADEQKEQNKDSTSNAWGDENTEHKSKNGSRKRDGVSVAARSKFQSVLLDGSTSPTHHYVKPYWTSWSKQHTELGVTSTSSNQKERRAAEILPAEPLYPVPENVAQDKYISHQVQAGRGKFYAHPTSTPQYIDSMESPYAVFVWKYRSREAEIDMLIEALERIIPGVKIRKNKIPTEDLMKTLSKAELLEFAKKLQRKVGSDSSNTDSSSENETIKSAKSIKSNNGDKAKSNNRKKGKEKSRTDGGGGRGGKNGKTYSYDPTSGQSKKIDTDDRWSKSGGDTKEKNSNAGNGGGGGEWGSGSVKNVDTGKADDVIW